MTDRDALFNRFRDQTASLLTPPEAKQVKDALGQFLQDKVFGGNVFYCYFIIIINIIIIIIIIIFIFFFLWFQTPTK